MGQIKIINENYVQIQGWMVKELKLKGNELLIYAIIYGFSQDGVSKYKAGLQYLSDWTNSTKQGCIKNLKNLIDNELIIKEEIEINNIKYCNYSANLKKVNTVQQSLIPVQQSLTNNKYNNKYNNKNTNIDKSILEYNVEETDLCNSKKEKEDKMLIENIKCIIDYLNDSIGTKYKYNAKGTIKDIKARFKEGYTLDDFYDVIDKKVKQWYNTDMQIYLRPYTLFGNKFENYVNEKVFNGKTKTKFGSKPSFDNTAGHTQVYHIKDEDFCKLSLEEKIKEIEKFDAVADMTKLQKEFFEQYCLAKDENGNLIKF